MPSPTKRHLTVMSEPSNLNRARRLSIAPMMDWTDRHCRYFHKLLAPNALLYTEMVTSGALLFGDIERHLAFDAFEAPVALQLGGSSPVDLAKAAQIANPFGYAEINLNVGCPSTRVQNGSFGACLMAEPELVRDCCAAIMEVADVPVTVKTRIGIDDSEDYVFLKRFVEIVAECGVNTFIIHARKAWLKGLSPKQNRDVPPLRYEQVYKLKQERPDLCIIINGGITAPKTAVEHMNKVDGVMIGRQAYQEPFTLPLFEAAIFGNSAADDLHQVLSKLTPYIDAQMALGVPFRSMARHVLGLFNGRPGARHFRRTLSESMGRSDAGPWLFDQALSHLKLAA